MNPTLYDFTKPAHLPVAWQERLTKWGRTALGLANKAWAKQLPIPLQAKPGALESTYAAAAPAQLPDPAVAYRVTVGPSRVQTLLVMPRILMLKLVGVLVGEAGETSEGEALPDRELTLIEENLADYFLAECWLAHFREAWPGEQSGGWILEGRETNPQCSRAFGSGDVLLAMHWAIVGPWGESAGIWLFPRKELLIALGDKASGREPGAEAGSEARRDALVQSLPMLVQIILGTTELKLSQLSRLQVGDVLLLDRGQDCTVARVGNRNLFHGQMGRNGSRKAFQIEAIVEK